MLSAEVYDVSPAASAVRILREHGADPWVVDFGSPEREEGGLERNLDDHVVAVSDAIERVRSRPRGRDVHLGGYSQGGMFCYQAAAYRRNEGVASVITFGSPGGPAGGDAARAPREPGRRRRRRSSPIASSAGPLGPGLGHPHRLRRCSTRSSPCASGSSSSSSSTTARPCCRASASGGS